MEGLSMKLVTAVIKPYQLDAVKEALHAMGVAGMTVSCGDDGISRRGRYLAAGTVSRGDDGMSQG